MFEYTTEIKMYDADPAGVLFFANQFRLVHDAYQAFLKKNGVPLGDMLTDAPFALPVVHAQTDFSAPLKVSDTVMIKLKLKHTGKSSFTIAHTIYKSSPNGQIPAGSGETVHVSIDRSSGQKIPLPQQVLEILSRLDNQG